jgi:hypothetical protein
MMDKAFPAWRSIARAHIGRLQVLPFKFSHLATVSPWYVSNTQIDEDLGVLLFADHIRALTDSFESYLADVGKPIVWQLGRYIC